MVALPVNYRKHRIYMYRDYIIICPANNGTLLFQRKYCSHLKDCFINFILLQLQTKFASTKVCDINQQIIV